MKDNHPLPCQGGYDYDFVDFESQRSRFECPICLLCQRDPHQTSCGHRSVDSKIDIMSLVHSPNANSDERSQTQIKGSAFGFLEDGRELNYNPHLTNRKK